ncbi:MAG: glycoside hydrolase family 13 protein [Bacillota bacterium]
MEKQKWWKESVVYQIYPRSFYDSNDDGIGDIEGIIKKLDYIKDLGVDILWLCPIYKSPNADNGYDIADYKKVMDEFGDIEAVEKLIREVHNKDMKIIFDLVVNHTSDEHEWFRKSKQSINSSYRDYYIWKDGKNDSPPNNWGSIFGGSAWKYNENSGQYYLHLFDIKQPDLNWENTEVRNKIYDRMRWWLDKGIDGFRMDVINMLSKDQDFPDGKIENNEKYGDGSPYFLNGPKLYDYISEMGEEVLFDYDIMTVGETPGFGVDNAVKFSKYNGNDLLNMVFHFEHMSVDRNEKNKWKQKELDLKLLKDVYEKWNKKLYKKGWNAIYLGNHDQPRIVSRFGNDKMYREESAKMLATLLLTMPGTPYLYQGDEIGMTNVKFDHIGEYRDVETINYYREETKRRPRDEVMQEIYKTSRDNARTPMQWNKSINAGFSKSTPWINVNSNYKKINVESSLKESNSILNYYKKIIELRKSNKGLIYGKYDSVMDENETVFAYMRTYEKQKYLIILNFFKERLKINLPDDLNLDKYEIIISNYKNNEYSNKNVDLKPYESIVFRLG